MPEHSIPQVRLLVAGGAGFIGSRTTLLAKEAGIETAALVRRKTDYGRLPGDVPRIVTDLTDVVTTTRAIASFDPTHVVNCTSSCGHPEMGPAMLTSWRDSVLATVGLLEACRNLPIRRVVHLSSSLVYANSPHPLNEKDPLEPNTPRGAMKLAAENAVRQWAKATTIPLTILRPFSVYGPQEAGDRLVPKLLNAARTGRPFRITSRQFPRDFVYVDDVATGILASLTRGDVANGAFNLGTGVETTTRELVRIVESVTGHRITIASQRMAPRPADRPHWLADISQARANLSWEPRPLEEGIQLTWDHFRS